MPQDISLQARGLFTNGNLLSTPEGAMSTARNIDISRPGVIEPRPGSGPGVATAFRGLLPYSHLDEVLGLTSDNELTTLSGSVDYGEVVPFRGSVLRFAEVDSNLYLTSSTGVLRHSGALATALEPAGVPQGALSPVRGQTAGSGDAVNADAQVAYRTVFLQRDGNDNLHIGAPSGRVTYTNPAFTIPVGGIVVTTGTAVVTLAGHPFVQDDVIAVADDNEAEIPRGNYTVTSADATTFTFSLGNGESLTSQFAHRVGYAARDAAVTVYFPKDIGSRPNVYFQVYRSPNSVRGDVPASDELALVYESTPVSPLVGDATFSRPDENNPQDVSVQTASAHGFSTNDMVRIDSASIGYSSGMFRITVTGADTFTYVDASYASASAVANHVYRDVCYDSVLGLWVAVGDDGAGHGVIATAANGKTWTSRGTSLDPLTRVVTNGAGAVVASGPTKAYASTNGTSWVEQTGIKASDAVFGGGYFVLVHEDDIRYSATGTSAWSTVSLGNANVNLTKVAYGNGTWVARCGGATFTGHAWATTIGSWTLVEESVRRSLLGFVFDGTNFVEYSKAVAPETVIAVGAGSATPQVSTDGAQTFSASGVDSIGYAVSDIAFNGYRYVSVGSNAIYYSADGKDWIAATAPDISSPASQSFYCVVWTGQKFLVGGGRAAATWTNFVYESTDGITWSLSTYPLGDNTNKPWKRALRNGGRTFLFSDTHCVFTDNDGTSWTAASSYPASTLGTTPLQTGAADGNVLIMPIQSDSLRSTDNGDTWSATGIAMLGVATDGNGTWVKVENAGGGNWCGYSTNGGASFTDIGTTRGIHVVWSYDLQRFVIYNFYSGSGGFVLFNPADHTTSAAYNSGATNIGLSYIFADPNEPIALHLTSSDGQAWTMTTQATSLALDSLDYSVGKYVGTVDGIVYLSDDAETWTTFTLEAGVEVYGAGDDGTNLLLVGTNTNETEGFTYILVLGPESAAATITLAAKQVVDSTPDSLLGAFLYTNPTQEGIAAAAFEPPAAADVCVWKNYSFFANTKSKHRATFSLTTPGNTDIVVALQSKTVTFDAQSTAVDVGIDGQPRYNYYTAGTETENVVNTALSFVEAVNRCDVADEIRAEYLSGPSDAPGLIAIESSEAFTVTSTALTPSSSTSTQDVWSDALFFSKLQEFEAVPLLNYVRVGVPGKAIIRAVPLQNAIIVLKEDGIYRLLGDDPSSFRVDPLDTTVRLLSSESVVVMSNKVYCFTTVGVAVVTETGITNISGPIDDVFKAAIEDPSTWASIEANSFAVGLPERHKYVFAYGETGTPTNLWVFDFFTETWVEWSFDAVPLLSATHLNGETHFAADTVTFVLVGDAHDRYLDEACVLTQVDSTHFTVSNGPSAPIEVGDALNLDDVYVVVGVDGDDVELDRSVANFDGEANVHRAIACKVRWSPKVAGNPGALHQFREGAFLFRQASFVTLDAAFSTDITPTEGLVSIIGSKHAISPSTPRGSCKVRVGVPRNFVRASEMTFGFDHKQAMQTFKCEGAQLIVEVQGEKVGKK